MGDQLITAIQQNPDTAEDQLIGALSTESQAESSPTPSRNRRSIFSGVSYPHPRNSDVLPRFSIRNHFHPHLPSEELLVDPVAPNPPTSPLQSQRPTNEEILQAQTNPSGPLEDFLRKRRRHYENRNEFPPNLPETTSVPSTSSHHPQRPFHRRNQNSDDPSRDQSTSDVTGQTRPTSSRFSRRHYFSQRDNLLLNRLSRRADGSTLSEIRRSRMRDDKKLCRLQVWDFSPEKLPEISLPDLGNRFRNFRDEAEFREISKFSILNLNCHF